MVFGLWLVISCFILLLYPLYFLLACCSCAPPQPDFPLTSVSHQPCEHCPVLSVSPPVLRVFVFSQCSRFVSRGFLLFVHSFCITFVIFFACLIVASFCCLLFLLFTLSDFWIQTAVFKLKFFYLPASMCVLHLGLFLWKPGKNTCFVSWKHGWNCHKHPVFFFTNMTSNHPKDSLKCPIQQMLNLCVSSSKISAVFTLTNVETHSWTVVSGLAASNYQHFILATGRSCGFLWSEVIYHEHKYLLIVLI